MASKILIVDDDQDALDVLNLGLADIGSKITLAISGRHALTLLQKNIPDVILLDLMMPGMSGFEVFFRLKNNPTTRYVPVIIVSAYDVGAQVLPGVAGVARKARSGYIVKVRQLVTDALASSPQ